MDGLNLFRWLPSLNGVRGYNEEVGEELYQLKDIIGEDEEAHSPLNEEGAKDAKSGLQDAIGDPTVGEPIVSLNRSNWYNWDWSGFMCLILAMVILIINVFCLFSCTPSRSLGCQPQFTFEITDKSQKAKDSLSGVREGLKMISYIAKDLSIADYSNVSSYDYLQHIDTLSDNNLYKHNFNGFCRFNKDTRLQTCLYANGIDVFSSLVQDIGYQLGQISSSEESDNLGTSLTTTYSHALITLDEIYWKSINSEQGYLDLDLEALTMIHNVRKMEIISKILRGFSIVILVISSLMCLIFLLINLSIWLKLGNNAILQAMITTGVFCHIIHLIFILVASELKRTFYNRLKSQLELLGVAILQCGTGAYLFMNTLIFSLILQIFLLGLDNKRF